MKKTTALVWMFTGLLLAQLFVVPIAQDWWLLVPIALLSTSLWSLLHEAIHGHFRGRWLAILFGSSIGVLRAGHLAHHRHNRVSEHADRVSALSYYFYLCGGLYAMEVALPFLSWIPKKSLERFAVDDFSRDVFSGIRSKLTSVRADSIAVLLIFGSSFYLYGDHWHFLAGSLFARAFLISWLDYIYHYDTPWGDRLHGRNLWLPKSLSAIILHFNLHGIHHKAPWLPWYRLPLAFDVAYDCSYWRAALNVWRGPIK